MFFKKSWQYVATGVDGNATLFGVNIFDHEWHDTGETAVVPKLSHKADVFTVNINGKERCFAAAEASNCVWNFYLYK